MMRMITLAMIALALAANGAQARQFEQLDRGLVARQTAEGVYLSWRLLETDAKDIEFHVERGDAGGTARRITEKPITQTTDFLDSTAAPGNTYDYVLRAGRETSSISIVMGGDLKPYTSIPLQADYTFQKAAIADLDGDGKYDFVLKQPGDNVDPYEKYWKRSHTTYKLEAYRHDGTLLWRHDMGWAIEMGIWYSPYVVYDLDGDGKAEVALKAGEGDPREEDGRVRTGAEYLLILDGETGRPITRAPWPTRDGFERDKLYNRSSRNQLGVAYLDGEHPSLIVARGTYSIMKVEAHAFDGKTLNRRWRWSNLDLGKDWWGQGAHWMHAADVDADGRDEIVLGSSVLDDNGAPLWSTGLGHPDHSYVGDIDPERPGLEIYYGIESRKENNGMCLVDAATGKILWGHQGPTRHVHSYGMCSDIDARHPGSESYSTDTDSQKKAAWARLRSADGEVLSEEMPWGFGPRTVYWDADPQRELLTNRVFDYGTNNVHIKIEGKVICVVDIVGDWREEIITSVKGELRIYGTTIPAKDRRACLMQDPLYRMDTAVASMGYYQVPMTSYDLASRP